MTPSLKTLYIILAILIILALIVAGYLFFGGEKEMLRKSILKTK